jgi:hypothetical protein
MKAVKKKKKPHILRKKILTALFFLFLMGSTNYLFSEAIQPNCWRYEKAARSLAESQGSKSAAEAMSLLQSTSQDHTMWSVVYNLCTGQISLALGKNYDKVHTFELKSRL